MSDLLLIPRRALRKWARFALSPPNLQAIAIWSAALAAGIVSVVFNVLFRGAESLHHRFASEHPALVWLTTPVLFLIAWWFVRRFSPQSGGSGVPQVIAALEAKPSQYPRLIDRFLSLRVMIVKITSAVVGVLGGAALGPEGPTVQISGCVFRGTWRLFGKYASMADPKAWITAGAAAGLALAFNTPLGGVVFAIEELKLAAFPRFRTLLLTSIIIAGLVSQGVFGSYLYLGYPSVGGIPFGSLPSSVIVGIVSGFMGAWFGRLLLSIMRHRERLTSFRGGAAMALCCGIVVAAIAHVMPASSGSGKEVITGLLFRSEFEGIGLAGARFISTIVSLASGIAGGIFAPSLSIGACIGSAMSGLFQDLSPKLMVLLGMAGFLTGVTRNPFTAFVLVLEMTDRHSAILPMMLAAISAEGVARYVQSQSFYEGMKRVYLERHKRSAS